MVPQIYDAAAGITTIKVIKPGHTRTLAPAQISTEAVLLMHGDADGVYTSDVSVADVTWRVTKTVDGGTHYTVATSTDGTTFTTVQDGGADREFYVGESFTSPVGDYEASFTFNDTIVNVGASSAGAAETPSCNPCCRFEVLVESLPTRSQLSQLFARPGIGIFSLQNKIK